MKLRAIFLILVFQCGIAFLCSAQTSGLAALFDLSKVHNITPEQAVHFGNSLSKALTNPDIQSTYSQLMAQQAALAAKGAAATPQDWSLQHLQEYALVKHVMQNTLKSDPTLAPVAAQVIAPVDPYLPQMLQRMPRWRPSGAITREDMMVRTFTNHQVRELFPELSAEEMRITKERNQLYANGRQPSPQELATFQSHHDHFHQEFDFAAHLVNPQITAVNAKFAAAKSNSNPTAPATPTSNPALTVPTVPSTTQGVSTLPSPVPAPTTPTTTPPLPAGTPAT